MNGADSLALNFGLSRKLRFAQAMLVIPGLMGILWSPASFLWKAPAILVLLLSAWRIDAFSTHPDRSGTISLDNDGTAHLKTVSGRNYRALLRANNWTSRWLCVMALYEADCSRHHYCVICAAENFSDPYRRLLVFLRMRSPEAEVQKVTW